MEVTAPTIEIFRKLDRKGEQLARKTCNARKFILYFKKVLETIHVNLTGGNLSRTLLKSNKSTEKLCLH